LAVFQSNWQKKRKKLVYYLTWPAGVIPLSLFNYLMATIELTSFDFKKYSLLKLYREASVGLLALAYF